MRGACRASLILSAKISGMNDGVVSVGTRLEVAKVLKKAYRSASNNVLLGRVL